MLLKWILPVAVTGGAIGLHFALHVPRGEYEPRPDKNAKKQQAAKVDPAKNTGFRPRRAVRLGELRRELAHTPYEDEPLDQGFARAHEGIVAKAVAVARKEAFRGAPELPQVDTVVTCKTIRCRIDVCSEFPPELDLLTASMISLEVEGERLFESLDVEHTTRGELGKSPPADPCFRIVVMFKEDLPPREKIAVPGAEPQKDVKPEDPAKAQRFEKPKPDQQ